MAFVLPPVSLAQAAQDKRALRDAANRRCTRITVMERQGQPFGVATLRRLSSAAIARVD
jgi:hypothetical protein